MFEDIETFKWLYGIIIAPFIAWAGVAIRNRIRRKRRRESNIRFLAGLPPECKSALIEFYKNGTHTMRGDPLSPSIKVLVREGVIKIGPGGGTYDAIDRYLTVVPGVWDVMDDWLAIEFVRNGKEISDVS